MNILKSRLDALKGDKGEGEVATVGIVFFGSIAIMASIISCQAQTAGEGPLQICDGSIAVFKSGDQGVQLVVGAPGLRNASAEGESAPVYTFVNRYGVPMHQGYTVEEGRWYELGDDGTLRVVDEPQSCEPVAADRTVVYGEEAIISQELQPGEHVGTAVREMATRLGQTATS